ncbi:MAG: SDR family oxidoreductase [Deltaproteobacteria bacterium]|nr:SDR family oxidoreductase [Deltaproteobacteria bacterium]
MRVEVSRTIGVMEKALPSRWREHLYGLTPERWKGLAGKSFWITGAGTGYGRSLTVALASAGARVFLTGRRVEKLKETLEEMRSLGISAGDCCMVPADITDVMEVTAACNEIGRLSASLNGLVNNAAIPARGELTGPLQDESVEYWERIMSTNLRAPWFLTREIFPHMRKAGGARVLFITSEAGWANTHGFGPYNVSKAGLNSLCASMAEEYAGSFPGLDVQMNALIPGEARTEMNRTSLESPYSIVSMALILLSHPEGGPNGKFFHRDGRSVEFCYSRPYERPLMQGGILA